MKITDKEIERWEKLLREREAHPYMKPNRKKHDSGYRCFEVGYLTIKDKKCKEKIVLSEHTDHVQSCDYEHRGLFMVNMDLLLDGYIRFFEHGKIISWGYWVGLSSMQLRNIKDEDFNN